MQETQVQSLGRDNTLEKEMVMPCNILAWKISWTEKPGGLQFMGLQKSQTRLSIHTHWNSIETLMDFSDDNVLCFSCQDFKAFY